METIDESSMVIGADLGGTKLVAGLFTADGTEFARERIEVHGLTQDELVESMVSLVERLTELADKPVIAAGFGVPTTFDQRTGTAVTAANLPISDLPLRKILQERTGLQVFLDNDANVAALAEQKLGAGAGVTDNLLMVTLGTGFGGGAVVDGRIMRGSIGAGAEFGHVSINYEGLPCIAPNCPGIGCVETYVGGTALKRDARALVEREPNGALAKTVASGKPAAGETVVSLAHDADVDCLRLLEGMGFYLGVALAGFVNILNPRVIAVGGGLTPALEFMLPVAQKVVRERSLSPANEYVQIMPAVLGSDAGMVGAALMARDSIKDLNGLSVA